MIIVDDDGGADFNRIQDAIDNASDGDIIFVKSGFYDENLLIDKQLTLIGENNSCTIIDGGGRKTVVILSADHVTVTGFTIQNSSGFWLDAGLESFASYSTIEDNTIKNNKIGIILNGVSGTGVYKNIIVNNSGQGVVLQSFSKNVTISNNIVGYNRQGGYISPGMFERQNFLEQHCQQL